VGVLGVAPYANIFIDALTQVKLTFPDELTPTDLEEYRAKLKAFGATLAG
jgi:hypothetical protein